MNLSRPQLAMIVLAVGVTSALSQTEDRDALRLSLADAVAQAIERNLDIAVARLDPKLSEEGIRAADAAFDPRFDAQVDYSRSEEEQSSAFSATKRDLGTASASFIDPLQTGGSWQTRLSYQDSQSTYGPGSENFGLIPNTYGATLSASITQPLLRNFGLAINRTEIEQARNSLKISEAALERRVLGIVEQTENAYWALSGARNALDVAKSSRALTEDFLRQTKIRVEVGTMPPIEITTAEAQVASREEAVIVAENNLRDAEDNLRQLTRVPQESADWNRPIIPTDEPNMTNTRVDVTAAIDTALKNRVEVREAALRERNLELDERFRNNQLRPDLSVNAALDLTGNNYEFDRVVIAPGVTTGFVDCDGAGAGTAVCFGSVPTPRQVDFVRRDLGRSEAFKEIPKADNTNWSVGALFSIPIGNRLAKVGLARTRIQLDQAKLDTESVKQSIRVEVRQAARGLESSAQRVASAKANVVLQRKRLEAEQKRFENGLSTSFQVLQAQNDLRDAENSQTNANVAYAKAQSRLAAAQGTLLAERGVKLDR